MSYLTSRIGNCLASATTGRGMAIITLLKSA
ncbi:UNVERIFIED_CONTAM: hypothetical protein GTU68_039762 [Idotea baltica]|nr:hypothetical protein [Idotea baltica]